MGGDACVTGSWPSAGAAAPRVKPPANVAPLFRSSRRLKRFEPIGLSFADEPKRKSLTRSRKYTPVSGSNRAQSGVPLDLAVSRTKPRRALRDVVTLTFASWNPLRSWLRQLDSLRGTDP